MLWLLETIVFRCFDLFVLLIEGEESFYRINAPLVVSILLHFKSVSFMRKLQLLCERYPGYSFDFATDILLI